jgi:hypothetical protein
MKITKGATSQSVTVTRKKERERNTENYEVSMNSILVLNTRRHSLAAGRNVDHRRAIE